VIAQATDRLTDTVAAAVHAVCSKGLANPIAVLYAAALMLEHVGEQSMAVRLRAAIDATVHEDNVRTRDLGGQATTNDFADALMRRVNAAR
jgi:isocitrate dehydrogenase (NAD+)